MKSEDRRETWHTAGYEISGHLKAGDKRHRKVENRYLERYLPLNIKLSRFRVYAAAAR